MTWFRQSKAVFLGSLSRSASPKDLPDAAALRAEIKAAPESDQHSDLFLSMAIAIWRARKIRKQIERGGLPPPKVLW